jgi:hypothetical protein
VSDTSCFPLAKDKDEERERRNNYIEREKRTDPRGEKLAHKRVHIEPMLRQPGNKLRIRQHKSEHAQTEVEMAKSHEGRRYGVIVVTDL